MSLSSRLGRAPSGTSLQSLFGAIKRTLLNASKILWVYGLDDPDAQMIVGLTRSLRSETLAKAATLGLEPEDLENPTAPIKAAINALWSADSFNSCKDLEFRTKGAELFVPVPCVTKQLMLLYTTKLTR